MTAEEWYEIRSEQLHRLHSIYTVTDEEFAGFSPSECFDLGIEFAQVWAYIRRGTGGWFSMHDVNQQRFEAMCATYGVHYTIETRPACPDGFYDVAVHLPME